jgi:hypothetical protein
MMRKSSLDEHNLQYDPKIRQAQDYELWTRAAEKVTFANIPEFLHTYRLHSNQVGSKRNLGQQEVADKVRKGQIKRLKLSATPKEIQLHHSIARWEYGVDLTDLEKIYSWLKKLQLANEKNPIFETFAFGISLEKRWWAACRSHVRFGLKTWQIYTSTELSKIGNRSFLQKSGFLAKCLLRELGFSR